MNEDKGNYVPKRWREKNRTKQNPQHKILGTQELQVADNTLLTTATGLHS